MKASPPSPPPMRRYKSEGSSFWLIAFVAFVLAFGILIGIHIK